MSQNHRIVSFLFMLCSSVSGQSIKPDLQVNSIPDNVKGIEQTMIAAGPNGTFAVAWQDYNDYNIPVAEQPRIAVRMFSATGDPIGPVNLFRGESRSLSSYSSDFLTDNFDVAVLSDGSVLVGVQHEGWLSLLGVDDIYSAEVGIGAISAKGEIIDANKTNGVILWTGPTSIKNRYRPNFAVAPNGGFLFATDGPTYETNKYAVAIQAFDSNGDFVGDYFFPHFDDPRPLTHHWRSKLATNGTIHVAVWQTDGRDKNDDVVVQFLNNNVAVGKNMLVNSGDAVGVQNIWPDVAINGAGQVVVTWADTRERSGGDVYGQRYSSGGVALGGNFKISAGQGEIWDAPEVAILDNGNFMVVWTDSIGVDVFKARGRQFDAAGNPAGGIFIIPEYTGNSGWASIATDGKSYYCSWADDRPNAGFVNVYAKKIEHQFFVGVDENPVVVQEFGITANYPNPFNPATTLRYNIAKKGHIRLSIFDVNGREIEVLFDGVKAAGKYQTQFDGSALSSGVYFAKLQGAEQVSTRKLTLLK